MCMDHRAQENHARQSFLGNLAPLAFDEILEVTGIHSAAGQLQTTLVTEPPLSLATPHLLTCLSHWRRGDAKAREVTSHIAVSFFR